MKFKGLATLALATSLTVTSTFAAPVMGDLFVKNQQKPMRNAVLVISEQVESKAVQDPINFLENKKAEIKNLVKEGKITQAEADAKIARIDEKIKVVEEFNKLSVPEKKEVLINHYKLMLDKKVEAGKMDRKEADTRLMSFTEKIQEWDGNGYPQFGRMCEKKR